ncbi:hypothetical protein OESDEN_18572 [Oesophagostomum dentatum]|uniref:Uncharacterized protein n=1 Tax=Oesophagostomum dentatum TaxID=61180 RepID=A0A0B1SEX0_OESDE|nr:hypothetical protein OESDEN_18572 [Oesophagostomum dentatum]
MCLKLLDVKYTKSSTSSSPGLAPMTKK